MGSHYWEVVGGGDKGGIIVRTGKDITSDLCMERLSTGAFVEEVELDGERLHYRRLSGTGPQDGWVSTQLPTKVLMSEVNDVWEVVGGGDKGGIFVRTGLDTASPACVDRLSTGALVKEVDLQGTRLNYKVIAGTGPAEGWVSTKLDSGRALLSKLEPAQRQATAPAHEEPAGPRERLPYWGPVPLDVKLYNEEKDFSYENLPYWVPIVASAAKLARDGQPFLPFEMPEPERLMVDRQLPPWKKLKLKELKEMSVQNLPGCLHGLLFPKTAAEMISDEFGAEWLTRAFHTAGTLSEDNRVTKLVRAEELPVKGFDAAGGAAMKMILKVEYLKDDPELHTELFCKYPYMYEEYPTSRQEVTLYGDVDGPEILCAMKLTHRFPFRTAKYYFCDLCRDTTNWILITEKIQFGRRGRVENGKIVENVEYKPYEILPVCGKYQDWLLPNPVEFYCCIFRTMGRLAAWDKLGHYDGFLGPSNFYDEATYLAMTKPGRQPAPAKLKEGTKATVGKLMDSGFDFVLNVVKNMVPDDVKDLKKLTKMKEELMEMGPYFEDCSKYYQMNDTDFQAAMHANLQADNAFFWRDEYGDMACGVLDWGGFSRTPFPMSFLGVLSGADAELLISHDEEIIRCLVDEYFRCGGPKLPLQEVMTRYHLGFLTFVYDSCQWIERDIYKQMPKEEIAKFTGVLDENFQAAFRVRCRSMTVVNAFASYIRRDNFKAIFDRWARGKGAQYLTVYQ